LSYIRAAVLLEGGCRANLAEPCEAVLELRRGNLCELWLKCVHLEEFFKVLERALNEGIIPVEIGFPTGRKVRGYNLSPEDLVTHGRGSLEVSGRVELEYYKPLGSWVGALKVARLSVDLGSSRAKAELLEPVSTSRLFDAGVRLLKPLRVPL